MAFVTLVYDEVSSVSTPTNAKAGSLGEASSSALAAKKEVTVLHDFLAETDEDLEMRVGDTIVILETVDNDWGFGRNVNTGKSGIFPWNFVDANAA